MLKYIVLGAVTVSIVSMTSSAEARRWIRRGYSTCPNGQCATVPVAEAPAQKEAPAEAAAQQATPATQPAEKQAETQWVSTCADGQCSSTYYPTARRARWRFRR